MSKQKKFNKGDEVKCTNFDGLRPDVVNWLQLKEWHPIKHVYSAKTNPILILEDIEGVISPRITGEGSYPFLSERFIKR